MLYDTKLGYPNVICSSKGDLEGLICDQRLLLITDCKAWYPMCLLVYAQPLKALLNANMPRIAIEAWIHNSEGDIRARQMGWAEASCLIAARMLRFRPRS